MRNKLPIRDQIYWKNFFQSLLIIACTTLFFSFFDGYFDLKSAIIVMFFFLSLLLSHNVGMYFAKCHDLDLLRVKKNMDWKEFREKYGDIIDIS